MRIDALARRQVPEGAKRLNVEQVWND